MLIVYFLGAPREYLESYVFPTLSPVLIEMLRQAKKEKCFEVKSLLINLFLSPLTQTLLQVWARYLLTFRNM